MFLHFLLKIWIMVIQFNFWSTIEEYHPSDSSSEEQRIIPDNKRFVECNTFRVIEIRNMRIYFYLLSKFSGKRKMYTENGFTLLSQLRGSRNFGWSFHSGIIYKIIAVSNGKQIFLRVTIYVGEKLADEIRISTILFLLI